MNAPTENALTGFDNLADFSFNNIKLKVKVIFNKDGFCI